MRYRLRTLLILLAIGPPLLAGMWFSRWALIAAVMRAAPEDWVRLFLVFVAIALVALAITGRGRQRRVWRA